MKRRIIIFFLGLFLLVNILGCEAFVRKFVRKQNKENLPKEEMVLEPEEYAGSQMSQEELYKKYFLFWRSWQDELVASLDRKGNHKKQVDCAKEAIKNLMSFRAILNEGAKIKLDTSLNQLNELNDSIINDIYGNDFTSHRRQAEHIRRNILRDFSYNDVKSSLI